MRLLTSGLNDKSAPLDVRERCHVSPEQLPALLALGRERVPGLRELVVLSTCNRTELYAVLDDDAADLRELWCAAFGDVDAAALYRYEGERCIDHLFTVTASLDSLVLGEGQILSQVKQAYAVAHEQGTTGTVLNLLFQRALATGKRVRTETRLAYNAVSVSSAAVALAKQQFGGALADKVALIYGAGTMAELALANLRGNGVRQIYIANRHPATARALADKYRALGAVAATSEALFALAPDLVLTSTGAPHYVLRAWDVELAMCQRPTRPLLVIDIAVPRDVEPSVANLDGVALYNLDDLQSVVTENRAAREHEAERARVIIAEEVAEMCARLRYLSLQPLMARMSDAAERVRQRELRRVRAKLPHLSPCELKAVEHMSRMIVRKLLREPMTQLSQSAGTERERLCLEAAQRLFSL